MTQAVEAHARREPSIKLGFGFSVDARSGSGDGAGERSIVERLDNLRRLHCASIA